MKANNQYDVIIIGGSYSGLAAAMALGRALRQVLIIDSGMPCNRQTPYSHNFITQDGKTPKEITAIAKQQVTQYETVHFFNGIATSAVKTESGFEIQIATREIFIAKKLIIASGIKDILPDIPGVAVCWGVSVIHCPYCHGYEVRNQQTEIFGNGNYGFTFSTLVSNWTKDLALYTNGKSTLTAYQTAKLYEHNIAIIEDEIERLEHTDGNVKYIVFKNGKSKPIKAIYTQASFEQSSSIPEMLECALNDDGYIKVDSSQKTTVYGVFASGDNSSKIRTVANAVCTGTTAGMMLNKQFIEEQFG